MDQVSELTVRDNTTIFNNQTEESTNSTTQTNNTTVINKSNTVLWVGVTIFILIAVGAVGIPEIGKFIYARKVNGNSPVTENIEMSDAMPTFNN